MKTEDAIELGIVVLLLFWPWQEQTSVTVGPPTSYGPCSCPGGSGSGTLDAQGNCVGCGELPQGRLPRDSSGFAPDPWLRGPGTPDPYWGTPGPSEW